MFVQTRTASLLSHIICIPPPPTPLHFAVMPLWCRCAVKMFYVLIFDHSYPAQCGLKYFTPLATVTIVSLM